MEVLIKRPKYPPEFTTRKRRNASAMRQIRIYKPGKRKKEIGTVMEKVMNTVGFTVPVDVISR